MLNTLFIKNHFGISPNCFAQKLRLEEKHKNNLIYINLNKFMLI